MVEALLVTIPQNTKYETILEEINEEKENDDIVLNHKLGRNRPKKQPTLIGIVYRGEIRFFGELIEYSQKEFKCTTTLKNWDKSWYAVFKHVYEMPKHLREQMKGFQGFKYHQIGEI